MIIWVNEEGLEVVEGTRLCQVQMHIRPEADVVIVNGYPISDDMPLADGDRITLIKKGEAPPEQEMEAMLVARHTPGVHEKVKAATVAIAGVGGLGSSIAVALCRTGFGRLILADFDVVEPSNLNRQQFFVDQIGQTKVEALKESLTRINPYVDIAIHPVRVNKDNLLALFADADIIVEAFDGADQKAMLVNGCRSHWPEKPLVSASGIAGHGNSNGIVTERTLNNLYLVGDGETEARPGQGLMAPRVGIAAHHQANAVLRLILGEEPV